MNDLKQKRIISAILDSLLIGLISCCVGLNLMALEIPMHTQISVMLFYSLFACKDCYNGASLGKYLLKIQIIDSKTLKAASPLKCVVRNYFLFVWIVELFMMLYSPQGRRIGDFVTNTKVVPFGKQQFQVDLKFVIVVVTIVFALSTFLLFVVKLRLS
ncbi:MAG: RDD family protein [Bacteroidaceae bacterium]|nr:RDD family protein [Bacteroidaceae bacterium]